jgi:heparan-alpha-glucosaminide N-acetyltransferase
MNPIAASVAAAQEAEAAKPKPPMRLASLDAYRGFVMFLMAAELLELPKVAAHFPDHHWWQMIARHSEHVAWTGCSLHDLIQPSFSFMVGVALPFSLARRQARGDSTATLWTHALWRALVLVLLGVFLRSIDKSMTYWTFEDTLSQIGLGYPLLFALGFFSPRVAWVSLAVILVGYWAAFAIYPVPPTGFDWARFRGHEWFSGFQAHWNQNGNVAWAFDRWFLNFFPRQQEFLGNGGGYSTLSFLPTLGTMILGLIAGRWLKNDPPPREGVSASSALILARLAAAGVACLAIGWGLDRLGICPSVKKIWTPAWTLFSGGWCFLIIATFYLVADVWGAKRLFFPLIVIGLNSIAIYVLVHTVSGFFSKALLTHFGKQPFLAAGEAFEPILHGGVVLLILWIILFWMHRRRVYLRI